MKDAEQRKIIEELAEWMGWKYDPGKHGLRRHATYGRRIAFRPFTDLNSAGLLLVECYRQHLASSVVQELDELLLREYGLDAWRTEWASIETWLEWKRLTSTPEQITLAVWAVVKLEQGESK